MNSFEYITVLVSIVVGLAIADLITSLHRLLSAGRRVTWDWIAPSAALLMLLELFNLWWKWHGFTGNTLGAVAPYFVALMLLFLSAAAALPDGVPESGLSLRAYFEEKRRYFWSVYTFYVFFWIGLRTIEYVLDGKSWRVILDDKGLDYLMMAVYAALIFVRDVRIGGVALVASFAWLLSGWWNMALPATQ